MKALLSKLPGGPQSLVLEDAPVPVPGPGEALIRVQAVGVNFPDVLIIEDKYQYRPQRPFSPGGELSGVVERLGDGCRLTTPGDRVLAMVTYGAMAEKVVVKESNLIKIPPQMPFDDAAAFLFTFGTSYHALKDRAQLKAGETLLILGAAGGVGMAALQLAKTMGARVVAAVSSAEKAEVCRAMGADEAVIYDPNPAGSDTRRALTAQFKQALGPGGADVVYDAVGGAYAEAALRAIAWAGRYLVVGFATGEIPQIPLNLALLKSCDIRGVFYGAWCERFPELRNIEADELLRLYAQGAVRPHIAERFPLHRGSEAIARVAGRKALGKVVITID
ncbi:MAG TPA: NADPH:quinone oxidoreductase family protein [Caulobacteraceae bacterium]|nr:NADPH:quinone oxidoreductase family protein [Caulobacteraceae bacterium]